MDIEFGICFLRKVDGTLFLRSDVVTERSRSVGGKHIVCE